MRVRALIRLFLAIGAVVSMPPADAGIRLVEAVGYRVEVRPMLVVGGESGALPAERFEIPPGEKGHLKMRIAWPDTGATGVLELVGTGRGEGPGGELGIDLDVRVRLPDGTVGNAQRSFRQREGAVGLFEVYRGEDVRITLAVSAEREIHHVPYRVSGSADRVLFRLDVDGVRGKQFFELESNALNTFVGEPVSYSFRRGEGAATESVQIVLTPLRTTGDVVEIRVEVSGSLPGEPSRLILGRRDTLVTTRGATSSVEVTAGDPPSGYRFRIRPEF